MEWFGHTSLMKNNLHQFSSEKSLEKNVITTDSTFYWWNKKMFLNFKVQLCIFCRGNHGHLHWCCTWHQPPFLFSSESLLYMFHWTCTKQEFQHHLFAQCRFMMINDSQSCQVSRFECDSHAIWPILTPHATLDISHAYFPIQYSIFIFFMIINFGPRGFE